MGALTDGAEAGEELRGDEPMEDPRSREGIPDPKVLPPDPNPRSMDGSSRRDGELPIDGEADCGTLRPGVKTRTLEPSTAGAELYSRSRKLLVEDAPPELGIDPRFSEGTMRRSVPGMRVAPGDV